MWFGRAHLPLLQPNCSNCSCTTWVRAARQLCRLTCAAHQKQSHRFLYSAAKQVVKWNTDVTVNCNQAAWNPVKGSQSKYRNTGLERLKKRGVPTKIPWCHKEPTLKNIFWLSLRATKQLSQFLDISPAGSSLRALPNTKLKSIAPAQHVSEAWL